MSSSGVGFRTVVAVLAVAWWLGVPGAGSVHAQDDDQPKAKPQVVAGDWEFILGPFPKTRAMVSLNAGDEGWAGTWHAGDKTFTLAEIEVNAETGEVTFACPERETTFEGTVKNDELVGTCSGEFGTLVVKGTRATLELDDIVGYWLLTTEFNRRSIESVLCLYKDGDELAAVMFFENDETEIEGLDLNGRTLRFTQSFGGGMQLDYTGRFVSANTLEGTSATSFGEFETVGKRLEL